MYVVPTTPDTGMIIAIFFAILVATLVLISYVIKKPSKGTGEKVLQIGYNIKTANTIMFLGIMLLILFISALSIGNLSTGLLIRIIAATAMTVGGYSMKHRPYFLLNSSSIVMYALLGGFTKSYSFSTLSDISAHGYNIEIKSGTKSKRLFIASWLVNQEDWDKFLAAIKHQKELN